MKSGEVFLGVVAGLTAGALLGVLFAPEKGSRTRREIVRKGDELADVLKDKFEDMLDTVSDKCESAISEMQHLVVKGKSNLALIKDTDHVQA